MILPSSTTSLEGDIYDANATSNQTDNFTISAPTLVEGDSGYISVTGPIGTYLEWWTEDYSANGSYSIDAVPGSAWLYFGTSFQIPFSTYEVGEFQPRRSFKVFVKALEDPNSTAVAEVDILPRHAPLDEFGAVQYGYDDLNQMVSRTFDPDGAGAEAAQTTYFSYQGGQIVFQFDDPTATTTAPDHRYLWNPLAVDQLLADEQVSSGTVLWPLTDQQGTIRDLATHDSATDTTTIALHRNYDAFGNLVSATGALLGDYEPVFEPNLEITSTIAATDELFGFTGRMFDEATGLQNNLNRWYDPKAGRWISEDPLGFAAGDTNLYRYVQNSPLNIVDPSGLEGSPTGNYWEGGPSDYVSGPFGWLAQLFDTVIGWSLDTDKKSNARRAIDNVNQPGQIKSGGNFHVQEGTKATISNLAMSAVVFNASALGGGFIRVTPDRMRHVIDRHTIGGAECSGASHFSNIDDLNTLMAKAVNSPPVKQARGRNFERIIDAGRIIGTDVTTGNPTSIYTVITDAAGNLITMFPGLPR